MRSLCKCAWESKSLGLFGWFVLSIIHGKNSSSDFVAVGLFYKLLYELVCIVEYYLWL